MLIKTKKSGKVGKMKPIHWFLQVILIMVAVVQLFPLIWLLLFSLKSNAELFGDNILGLPMKWLWTNYTTVLKSSNISRYFINSVIVTVVTIIITNVLSAMVSYAITRLKWKLSNAVYILFLTGMMIPIHAALLPLFIILKPVLNTYLALIIPYVGFALPLSVLILTGFMGTIPREIEEAAFLDGAGIGRIFTYIIVPLMKPAIATISVLTYLSSWNELMFAITFVNKEIYKTLTFGIMSMVGRYTTNWGLIGAGLVIATIPSIVIYMLMSEQIQGSLSSGALKG
jgi:raffinose/stachyose/melibiose transport system permease protein